jgi:hypothetical protein
LSNKVTISVVVDEETQKWLEDKAKRLDLSVSRLVREIIKEHRVDKKEVGSL